MALLYTFIPILELKSRTWPTFRLPGVKANKLVGDTAAFHVPDEVEVGSVSDEPDMVLFLLLLLKG